MSNYLTLNTVSETTCLIVALLTLTRDRSAAWRLMPFYLLIMCIIELMGIYIKSEKQSNSWIYNLLLLAEIAMATTMFYHLLQRFIRPKILLFDIVILLATVYIYELVLHGPLKRHYLTNVIFGITIVLLSLYYCYLLIKDERYLVLYYNAEFWWMIGMLLFYFGFTCLNIFYSLLANVLPSPNLFFTYTFKILNVLLYGIWSYSFICRRWQQRNLKY